MRGAIQEFPFKPTFGTKLAIFLSKSFLKKTLQKKKDYFSVELACDRTVKKEDYPKN